MERKKDRDKREHANMRQSTSRDNSILSQYAVSEDHIAPSNPRSWLKNQFLHVLTPLICVIRQKENCWRERHSSARRQCSVFSEYEVLSQTDASKARTRPKNEFLHVLMPSICEIRQKQNLLASDTQFSSQTMFSVFRI